MPYIGRELDSGNYLKLDDISSSFNGSTTTFNLTAGGKAFFPGSAFSILVSLAGVTQEPEAAYQISNSQITFATAPASGDQFFCIVLGVALGVSVPGNGTVDGAQLAKPFNYDGYFYLDDANNRVGVGTATPAKPLHVVGEGQFDSVRVLGDLQVDGTTTTLDTVVTEVDKLEVGANNSTVGVAITQSGSGDILNLYDSSSSVFSVADGGTVTASGDISIADKIIHTGDTNTAIRFPAVDTVTVETSGSERFRVTSAGNVGIGSLVPVGKLDVAGNVRIFEPSSTAARTLRITNSSQNLFLGVEGTSGGGNIVGSSAGDGTLSVNGNLRISANNGASANVSLLNSGSVGIGTITPQSQFEVYGSSPIVRSKHSTSQKYTQINHNGTDGYVDWSSGNLILRGASNTERLRITSGGDVNVGNISNLVASGAGKLNVLADNTTNIGDATDGAINISCVGGAGGSRTQSINWVPGFNVTLPTASIGHVFTDGSGYGKGDLFFATRGATTNTAATERLRITSDGKIGIGEDDPDGNYLLIRAASTVGTTKGHIMLTGDSATNGQGPQIVFSESGSGSSFAGAYVGHIREGSNSTGALVFGTRSTGGDANTVPVERVRITSAGKFGIGTNNPQEQFVVSNSGAEGFEVTAGVASNINKIVNYNRSGGSYSSLRIDAAEHIFRIGASEKLRITSAGNLNIINGNLQIGGTNILNSGRALYNVEQIKLADTKELVLGSSDDLKIYHDGSKSLITDSGTGHLEVDTNDFRVQNAAANETILTGTENGSVDLYYDNSRKFQTTSGGVNVTGELNVTTKVAFPDSAKAIFGAGDDLQIYHDGSNSYIDDAGTGALFVRGSYLAFAGINGEQLINAEQNAAVELFHNNSRKFQTTTTGAKVTGNFEPEADATRDLGSASLRWANIYSADLQLSNEGAANDVDGTWGQYTIQEGEDDLFLINRRNGKKYKFMLQEVN